MKDCEVATLKFDNEQLDQLHTASLDLARHGGPQAPGAALKARLWARLLEARLDPVQQATVNLFADGRLAALLFARLRAPKDDPLPEQLPELCVLEKDLTCLYLGARNQVLLELVRYRAFAFDIDNDGKHLRLVGNFKGGGRQPRPGETRQTQIELSSHAGLRLGPHTEAPYHCSVLARDGHSPAPSALVLSARWNPANQPTRIVPLRAVIEGLGSLDVLALSSRSFDFTRSECFVDGRGAGGSATSIIDFDAQGGFSVRYNAYRFSLNEQASDAAARAFDAFQARLAQTPSVDFVLQPDSVLLVNNTRALHGRERLDDNRRLLVRLFGYSRFARPLILKEDPLLVRG
ncbi:TauD/TfdA family dioxygenase [Pseudomonas japonica]|uniref:Taurine catabolism dioxygenase TauD, TfdA family n=1 Tax=Pseudomonas japonica TaxID=256466 RepID=A0A239EGI1_9PSED|nr:TauD/TfdA family dioxygenase [Pseudomonas japonica]SNS43002.1 Taurine catabolism dioxygenase TauD, TfdA family [Pseudomonas japonica]